MAGRCSANGIVLFHISNRYLDLKPVIADIAARDGWTAAMMEYVPERRGGGAERHHLGLDRLVAQSGDDRPADRAERRRRRCPGSRSSRSPGFSGWSDDHASILPIINYPDLLPFGSE